MGVVHERRRSRHAPDARTVEDLLFAQRLPIDVSDDAFDRVPSGDRVQQETVIEAPRPESTWSRVAKLAGLTTATSLLVGAVVASSVLTRQRAEDQASASPAPPQITGAAALGGFMPESPATPHASGAAAAAHQPSASASSALNLAQQKQTEQPPSTPANSPSTSAQAVSTGDKIAVVERFYHRMADQPERALAMLAPDLAGDEPGDLVRAWSSMSSIQVDEVQVQADGAVRAVVTMVQNDGTRLRVTQVLGLSGDEDDVISRAVLLSAEQL